MSAELTFGQTVSICTSLLVSIFLDFEFPPRGLQLGTLVPVAGFYSEGALLQRRGYGGRRSVVKVAESRLTRLRPPISAEPVSSAVSVLRSRFKKTGLSLDSSYECWNCLGVRETGVREAGEGMS